jgi:hypothetical protein
MPTPPTHSIELPQLPPIEVALDERGQICEDINCRACGYDLRGLKPDGRCPECGAAVGRSIHGDLLRFSDPEWVRGLADGAWWMILTIFLSLGLGITGGIIDGLMRITILAPLSGIVAALVGLVGYWKITAPDPGAGAGPTVNIQSATRILAVLGCGGSGTDFFLQNSAGALAGPVFWTSIAFLVALTLAGLVGSILMFILMSRIARRIPNDRLAERTGIVMWGLVFGSLLIGVVAVAAVVTLGPALTGQGANPGPVFAGIALIGGCGGLLLMAIFGIWWIVLLFQYRKALFAAADAAHRTWMRPAGDIAGSP